MDLTIYIDGGSRGNPGPAAAGVVIRQRDGRVLHEAGYFLGEATNNAAEYQGLIRAITAAQRYKPTHTQIFSDSELMVRQITGEYRVKSPELLPLFEEAQVLLLELGVWLIKHVRRNENARADELVNMALDRGKDVIAKDETKPDEGKTPGSRRRLGRDSQRIAAGGSPRLSPEEEQPATVPASPAPTSGGMWTAQFCAEPNDECTAPCTLGQVFTFGPVTPAGVCIHAAGVILEEGPLDWPDSQTQGDTFCPRCKVKIKMQRIGQTSIQKIEE